MINDVNNVTPLEQPAPTATARKRLSIGLPRCASLTERRFPLTPEAVKILTEEGFSVIMENNGAEVIHYTDNNYSRCGATIASRDEALGCDIVIHLAPLPVTDIKKLRRGALLLTLLHLDSLRQTQVKELLDRGIVSIAIDLILDGDGNRPFADILSEIDGRAAIALASSLLADACHGKGILLGGIAGIVPCEVTLLGSGIAACAAARSALGAGAIVRMFDNDVYRLRTAVRDLGQQVIGSAFHPRVLENALRTADVVIATDLNRNVEIGIDTIESMKRGVLTFDIATCPGKTFPSMPTVDLAVARPADNAITGNMTRRVCYVNAGSAVPRTAAMALSNTFITMLNDLITCEGVTNALKLTPGLQAATLTFLGKAVNRQVAKLVGIRYTDINLFLQLS